MPRRAKPDWTTTTNDRRKRPMVTITLSPEARARLEELVDRDGESRSAIVDALILAAR